MTATRRRAGLLPAAALIAAAGLALLGAFQSVLAAPSLELAINGADDASLNASRTYEVALRVLGGGANGERYRIELVEADPGVVLATGDVDLSAPGRQPAPTVLRGGEPANVRALIVPPTASGEYELRARVSGGGLEAPLEAALTLTVRPALPLPIDGVGITLGPVGHHADAPTQHPVALPDGDAAAASYERCADADPERAGAQPQRACIALEITVRDAYRDVVLSGLQGILLVAPGAVVLTPGGGAGRSSVTITNIQNDVNGPSARVFIVKRTAGPVYVSADAFGAGFARSEPLSLVFGGEAEAIELGQVSGSLAASGSTGGAAAAVTATDAQGAPAALSVADAGDLDIQIVDARGAAVETISASVDPHPSNLAALLLTLNANVLTPPGEYALRVSFRESQPLSVPLLVAGPAAQIALDASQPEGSSVITLSAQVSDEDGRPVADGTAVVFRTYGDRELTALRGDGSDTFHAVTTAGLAQARYVLGGGAATSTVIASVPGRGGLHAITAFPEISLDCLSGTSEMVVWTCSVEIAASQLFALLAADGASAVFLRDDGAWVRYAEANGTPLAGAFDFTVAEHAILYISR